MANNINFNNQAKSVGNNTELRRDTNDFQMPSQFVDSQNITNLLLPNAHQGASGNHLLGYQSNSFSGLYGSPGFNGPLAGYENNLQWLTDNRIQSQHNQLSASLIPDKTINSSVPSLTPTTSHSCCVNRFSVLDSLGVSSPIPNDTVKSACDVPSFQNKTSLSMSVIDPIQSWLNLQIPPQMSNNQQYSKYVERPIHQNYNIPVSLPSQINFPVVDQSSLKQADVCIQNQEPSFEHVNTMNTKLNGIDSVSVNEKQSSFQTGNKSIGQVNSIGVSKQQSSHYQTNPTSKEWKTTFPSVQNYISSPSLFSTGNDPQENYLFAQYSMPSAKLYYSPSDSFTSLVSKNSTCITQEKNVTNYNENIVQNMNLFVEQNLSKSFSNSLDQSIESKIITRTTVKDTVNVQQPIRNNSGNIGSLPDRPLYNNSFSDCCQTSSRPKPQLKPTPVVGLTRMENNKYGRGENNEENKSSSGVLNISQESDKSNQGYKKSVRISEAESSESDESNIIVEESDDIGEIESEISIEEIKKTYKSTGTCSAEVMLRCFICNTATSSQTPANQFIHMNDSFPLTTAYHTPVRSKLEQIIPRGLQHYLKIHNSFMCRRCFNLIETVEVLEVKLKTTKQTISDNFSKTVQQLVPEVEELLQTNAEISVQVEQLFRDDDKKAKSVQLKERDKVLEPVEPEDKSVEDSSNDEDKIPVGDVEGETELKCNYCSKILSSQTSFNLHLQQHTKEFNFYCEICGKGFPLKSSLERHLNWHNGDDREVRALCEICGESFPSVDIFKSHCIKYHSKNFSFECKICGKGFTRKISLEIHSHKHSGDRMFICEFCGHTFTSEANLKSHIRLCTKDLPFKCDVCPKSFALQSQLANHSTQHEGIYKFNCSICNKGFSKPSNLSYHMVSHSKEKTFKCENCDKYFKTVWSLNYHSKVAHKDEKIFVCSICGRNFGRKVLLADHMNSHTNEQPYKCFQCEKSFTHQPTFITHMRVHTGKVKMKTCPECGKSIKTRMSIHMRTHSGEKPYQCTFCPLAFSVSGSLKKHIVAKHRTVTKPSNLQHEVT